MDVARPSPARRPPVARSSPGRRPLVARPSPARRPLVARPSPARRPAVARSWRNVAAIKAALPAAVKAVSALPAKTQLAINALHKAGMNPPPVGGMKGCNAWTHEIVVNGASVGTIWNAIQRALRDDVDQG
eukprot:gene50393-35406_t